MSVSFPIGLSPWDGGCVVPCRDESAGRRVFDSITYIDESPVYECFISPSELIGVEWRQHCNSFRRSTPVGSISNAMELQPLPVMS